MLSRKSFYLRVHRARALILPDPKRLLRVQPLSSRALTIETKNRRVRVLSPQTEIPDDLRCNQTVGDPIAAVTEREVSMRSIGQSADIRQAIPRLRESAGPSIRHFEID